MRHAHKNAATNEEPKPSLVPRLRFPDFEGEWETRSGDDLFDQISERNPGTDLPVLAITQEHGAIPRHMIEYHVSVTEKSIESYKLVRRGDFIISLRSFQGGIEYSHYNGLCSPAYVILRRSREGSNEYYKQYLKTDRFILLLTRNLEGLRDGKMISYRQFSELRLPIPKSAEQQRIASCLSSLDELIGAQARKVDALKTHKKGLMQQLFPREGETLPRLRFPEFEGEWEERRLGDVATFHKGKGISKADISINGRTPCIRYGELYTVYGEIVENVQSRTDIPVDDLFLSQSNDVIIPASGETRLDIAKAACVIHDDVALGGDLNVIRTSHRGVFLSYYLNGPKRYDIAKVAQGDTVAHLYPSQLKKLVVSLPSEAEQQRIASCLSSLDELITKESNKLETYKTHKKGLMQGLFPKVEESTT
ncbi:MAG: restriction endonuclease subunit S [Bacteroidota bacterium]|jgi:type I restriction enzyme S subunit